MRKEKRPYRTGQIPAKTSVVLFVSIGLAVIYGCKESQEHPRLFGKGVENLRSRALAIIDEALSNPDPQIRAKAAEVVAATGQKQLMPKVQNLLTDDYVPVRFLAALAVGDMDYYLAKTAVWRLFQVADENTKIAAAYALYKLGDRQYLEPIRKAALSSDQTVRANAVMLLGKAGDDSVLELLYWAKNDDDSEPKVRYQAAESIAELGDKTIMPKLWTLLVSKFVENKIIGIRAMAALGTIDAKEALITKLDDDVLEVRLTAAEELAVLGDMSGQDVVLSVFKQRLTAGMDRQSEERVMVLTALAIGRIGTPKLTRYLAELIRSDSPLVRLAAAQAVLHAAAQSNTGL